MADSCKLTISVNGISQTLNGMLNRSDLIRGFLNRVAYPIIIEAQRMRWASEGSSEGDAWEPINPKYAARKLKKWRDAPGGGRKLLIASGKLVEGVTGDNTSNHYKLVEENRISVGTLIAYAKYVNEKRNFTELSQQTVDNIALKLGQYLSSGKE